MVEVPLLVGFDFDNQIVQQKPPPPSFPPSELRPYTTFDYSSLACWEMPASKICGKKSASQSG
jgi:hypothetical protein